MQHRALIVHRASHSRQARVSRTVADEVGEGGGGAQQAAHQRRYPLQPKSSSKQSAHIANTRRSVPKKPPESTALNSAPTYVQQAARLRVHFAVCRQPQPRSHGRHHAQPHQHAQLGRQRHLRQRKG
jgi:hypothetical protein